jgi:hypothetical protein
VEELLSQDHHAEELTDLEDPVLPVLARH